MFNAKFESRPLNQGDEGGSKRNSSTVDQASVCIILYPTEASDDDRPEWDPLRLVIAAGLLIYMVQDAYIHLWRAFLVGWTSSISLG